MGDRTAVADVSPSGAFTRVPSAFRRVFGDDHPVEPDRYVLHVSLACPWACRALAVLKLKGLERAIKVRVTHPVWRRTRPDADDDAHCGWVFVAPGEHVVNSAGKGRFVADARCDARGSADARSVRDLYEACGVGRDARFTVPLIWDEVKKTIVNNESADIVRELNSKWNAYCSTPERAALDLYPEELREKIDEVNAWVYDKINNGVYKCGFATSQEAYDEAVTELFDALDRVERILSESRYLCGDVFTEADVRLFMTLIRFDEVYVVYFKTNKKFIHQYEHMFGYLRELYQMPELAWTVSMSHIKNHYFASHPSLNVHAVVPCGPSVDLNAPHGRDGPYPRR